MSCNSFRAKIDVKQGNDLYAAKKYEEAIAKYKTALDKDSTLSVVWLNLGLSYMAPYVPGSTHPKDVDYRHPGHQRVQRIFEIFIPMIPR